MQLLENFRNLNSCEEMNSRRILKISASFNTEVEKLPQNSEGAVAHDVSLFNLRKKKLGQRMSHFARSTIRRPKYRSLVIIE